MDSTDDSAISQPEEEDPDDVSEASVFPTTGGSFTRNESLVPSQIFRIISVPLV